MIYYSAMEVYFFKGLKAGIGNNITNISNYIETIPMFNTIIAKQCAESFKEGFMWGLAMSMEDYRNLTEFRTKKKVIKPKNNANTSKVLDKEADKDITSNLDIPSTHTYLPNVKGNA